MKSLLIFFFFILCYILSPPQHLQAAAYPLYQSFGGVGGCEKALMPVVGFIDTHVVAEKETLLEIARNFGIGFNQMASAHPEIDPWIPREGVQLDIPSQWVLPPSKYKEVVINIPEMRLYRFFKDLNMVRTYPIGIGREGLYTPVGSTRVKEKIVNPSWTVPPSAWEKHGRKVVPPGQDNPLGDHWIGLELSGVGIHGTNFPWGVGRRVSHGCFRLYPEDIRKFFNEVNLGTVVEIIYEPAKIGVRGSDIYLEVHADIYNRIPDMDAYVRAMISANCLEGRVDPEQVRKVIREERGVPQRINMMKQEELSGRKIRR